VQAAAVVFITQDDGGIPSDRDCVKQQGTSAAPTLAMHRTNANAIAPIDPRRIAEFINFHSPFDFIILYTPYLPLTGP
jgi:hypothetical protein